MNEAPFSKGKKNVVLLAMGNSRMNEMHSPYPQEANSLTRRFTYTHTQTCKHTNTHTQKHRTVWEMSQKKYY